MYSTAGEAFCGSARIPEPILVPITRAAAPAIVPFFFFSATSIEQMHFLAFLT